MKVYYFSGSGHTAAVAAYAARRLSCEAAAILPDMPEQSERTALVAFPVYCEDVPPVVKHFLYKLRAERIALLAVYGGISFGNSLQRAYKCTNAALIAAAAVASGHTFLQEDAAFDPASLEPFFACLAAPVPIRLPACRAHPLARLFPGLRSRMGVKILRTNACTACKTCNAACPQRAMHCGKPDAKCIRCMKCVHACPYKALAFAPRPLLVRWLRKHRRGDTVVFLPQKT